MRKIIVVLGVIGLLCASVSPLLAGGIINKSNLSADYFRSLTRHGSTDAADIVAYNPAGVMKMDNGFYTKLDVLYINKDYSNTVTTGYKPGKYSSDEPSIVPGFFTVFKQDKWAGFFAVTIPGGGGEVDYSSGNGRTAALGTLIFDLTNAGAPGVYTSIGAMKIEANSFDVAYTLGGAFEINEIISLAGGLRYVDAKQEFKGSVNFNRLVGHPAYNFVAASRSVDLERTATGWGYFLGVDIAPIDKLNIGVLYQSNTDLDYKSEVSEGNDIASRLNWGDGTKEREDLPGILGIGISYNIMPQLRAEVDYTRYLESNAKFEADRFVNAGDSWEVGLSLTYTFNPQWRASVGYLHTDIEGMDAYQMLPEAAELDAKTIGVGAVYSPNDQWQFSLGYTNVDYDSVTTDSRSEDVNRSPAGTIYEKDVWAISAGVQYRWF